MLSLLPLFFAKTPAEGTDSNATGGAATLTDSQGKPAQNGATSDVVIPKKEYADLLSAKGYLSSFQSNVDKRLQQYEAQIKAEQEQRAKLQAELERTKKLSQKSVLDQMLEKREGDDNDLFTDETNPNLLKQVVQALQTDIDMKLSTQQAEIQRLNDELTNAKNENITASRIFQRKLNIDNTMNLKAEKLMNDFHISRDEAEDFISSREKIISALQDIQQADDSQVGSLYSLVDDIIDGVAERKNKLSEHKTAVEKAEQERNEKIKSLLEGDKKPRTQVTLNLNKPEDHGLSAIKKGETREEYAYRQIQELLNKDLAKTSAGSNRYK